MPGYRKTGPGRYRHFKKRFPQTSLWLAAGLVPKSALALAEAGYKSLSDLRGATREELRRIPEIGASSIAALEAIFGGPEAIPRTSGIPRPPLPEDVWRRRGIPPAAAITFAQMGMTLQRLESITREELLGLRGVGRSAFQACERLLGRDIPSRKAADPVEPFWRSRGLPRKAARALSRAGVGSLEDVQELSREEVLGLPGVGKGALSLLEALVGREIPSRTAYWLNRGLTMFVANALGRAGIYTLEALERLSREEFLAVPGLGSFSLRQCERLLQRKLPSRVEESNGDQSANLSRKS